MNAARAVWSGEPVRLDRALAELGLARSRSHAAELIARGRVRCDGSSAAKAGARVSTGTALEVEAGEHYVSRAAHKLVAGLDAFTIDVARVLALDLGASTGGFTQVLLERGARQVIALDVGHGQLVPELRADARVKVVEGCNARELDSQTLTAVSGIAERPELVVADLSFISLVLVFPAIARTAPTAQLLLLVKPQFEVGRQGVRDGIVIDMETAVAAAIRVLRAAVAAGFACAGIAASPITGEHGNRELLAHFVPAHPGANVPDPTEWEQHIRELLGGEA